MQVGEGGSHDVGKSKFISVQTGASHGVRKWWGNYEKHTQLSLLLKQHLELHLLLGHPSPRRFHGPSGNPVLLWLVSVLLAGLGTEGRWSGHCLASPCVFAMGSFAMIISSTLKMTSTRFRVTVER